MWSGKVPGSAEATIMPTASRTRAGARSRLKTAWAQLQCFLSNNLPWGDAASLRDARRRVTCNAMLSLVCLCTCLEPLLAIAAEAHNIAGSAENRISRSTGSAQTSGSAQNIATAQWLCMLVLPWRICMLLVSDIQASGVWCMLLLLCTPKYIT